MSEEANTASPCKNKDAGCPEIGTEAEMKKHGMFCSYNINRCPFEGCKWTGSRRDLLLHFLKDHKESVLDSPSFIIEKTDWNTFKILRRKEMFYLLALSVQTKDRGITITEVSAEAKILKECQIRWSTMHVPSQWTTVSDSPMNLKNWLAKHYSPALKVDIILPGLNTCSKCDGLLEFRWAECKNNHTVCMGCFPRRHTYCYECEEDLKLTVDYKYKVYPGKLIKCLRFSCYFLTGDLKELEKHEAECVFKEDMQREEHSGSSLAMKYSEIPVDEGVERIIYKNSDRYRIRIKRTNMTIYVKAACDHMSRPSFLMINMHGLCQRSVDPIPVTRTGTFEKSQYYKIAIKEEAMLIFSIINYNY